MNHVALFHSEILPRIRHFVSLNNALHRKLKTKSASNSVAAVTTATFLEHPIVVLPKSNRVDLIGPPDPVSNLRPVIRYVGINETLLQRKLRKLQDDTQAWNQDFWSKHNLSFIQEKQEYVNKKSQDKSTLTAEEMSEFYKSFLDKHWSTHVTYNFQWYKRNFKILLLSIQVYIEDLRS